MVATGPAVTITDAVPDTLPPDAVTVPVKVPGTVPARYTPELLMVPPLPETDQVGVNPITLPLASWPTAVNCALVLIARVCEPGVMVMLASGNPASCDKSGHHGDLLLPAEPQELHESGPTVEPAVLERTRARQ